MTGLVDVFSDGRGNLTRRGTVAGVGKRHDRLFELARNSRRDRGLVPAVFFVCAHALFFGYGIPKVPRLESGLQLPLQFHDVDDAERFVRAIARRSSLRLSHADAEDFSQWLLVECWQLSLRYERGDPQYPPRFSVYATNILRRRSVDWIRQQNGRTIWRFGDGPVYERPRRDLVSFDDPDARDRLAETLAEGNGDREADWDSPLGRLYAERDRERTSDFALLDLHPRRRVEE